MIVLRDFLFFWMHLFVRSVISAVIPLVGSYRDPFLWSREVLHQIPDQRQPSRGGDGEQGLLED